MLESILDLEGKKVIILGRSNIVGKPLSFLLTNKNATVTLAHSKSKNLKESRNDLINLISQLNSNGDVDGILVQLPLPKHISEEKRLALLLAPWIVNGDGWQRCSACRQVCMCVARRYHSSVYER